MQVLNLGIEMLRMIARSLLPKKFHISAYVEREVVRRCNDRVARGIFSGMRYVSKSYGSVWLPKILGTYELELEDTLRNLLDQQVDAAIVVGAAEGYYAVGLATREKVRKVVAFEPSPEARKLIFNLAHLNKVDFKVAVHGLCDIGGLRSALSDNENVLVVMDIEGGEALLLDPSVVGELKNAKILVELHEFAVPGVGELIRRRFLASHEIMEINARPRQISDWPFPNEGLVGRIKEGASLQLMSERRPSGMSWLIMSPNKVVR